MANNLTNLPPSTIIPGTVSSVLAMVTALVKTIPNEEFGVLSRWMNEEANRRREHVKANLSVGASVVFVNTTGKLTRGDVVELGAKNAKVRSEHGGELFIPLARLERADFAAARLSSLPPSIPPPIPAASFVATPRKPSVKKAKPRKSTEGA